MPIRVIAPVMIAIVPRWCVMMLGSFATRSPLFEITLVVNATVSLNCATTSVLIVISLQIDATRSPPGR